MLLNFMYTKHILYVKIIVLVRKRVLFRTTNKEQKL